MNYTIYVTLSGENKIARLTMDPESGDLERNYDTATGAGPAPLCMDPQQQYLYAGNRSAREIATFRIDRNTGELSHLGSVALEADPCCLATDKTGRFLLSAYYGAGIVAVHPIDGNGLAHGPPIEWRDTARKAHFIETDATNQFAFVPHVGESNAIFQFRFDESTGRLTPNAVPKIEGDKGQGPRHLVFHPSQEVVYSDNEQSSSVTAYRFETEAGTLEPFQTLSTLPEDFAGENSNAQIHIHPTGKFLYASNRGHNSIACFRIDAATSEISSLGQQPTESVPRAFNLDPDGNFLFAAGLETGRLASYRILPNGSLKPLRVYEVGRSPMWVLPVKL